MSYAVIQSGGKQYKVKSGEILKIEKLPNSKFCIYHDSKNLNLKKKIIEIEEKVRKGLPTIPSILKDEIKCNIFLKAKDLESFSKLRDLKDNF